MAMRVKFKVDGPTIDVARFESLLVEGMSRLWDDSIAEFVRAVALSDTIHVNTGMSVASVAPLARQVRLFSEVMAAASGGIESKAGGSVLGSRGSNITRSKEAGRRLGEDAFSIIYPKAGNQTMSFEFRITVFQYFLNESSNNYSGSLNYQTIDKGRAALRAFFIDNKFNSEYFPRTEKWLRLRSWVK